MINGSQRRRPTGADRIRQDPQASAILAYHPVFLAESRHNKTTVSSTPILANNQFKIGMLQSPKFEKISESYVRVFKRLAFIFSDQRRAQPLFRALRRAVNGFIEVVVLAVRLVADEDSHEALLALHEFDHLACAARLFLYIGVVRHCFILFHSAPMTPK